MTAVPATVTREIDFLLIAPAVVGPGGQPQLPVRLHYDTTDPFAVHLLFHAGRQSETRWVFARELLTLGLSRSAGEGDVRIWPSWSNDCEVLRIALITSDRTALLEAPAGPVLDFLSQTFLVCPWGTEVNHTALDDELRVLMSAAELREE